MTRWRAIPLGSAIELAYGRSLPKGRRSVGGHIPVYGSNGVTGWHDEALVTEPTVIVGRKGSAGAVQYVDGPCYPIDTTYFVRPRSGFDFDTKFLFYLLRRLDLSRLRTATGVPGLTREDAYREMIPLPSIDEQQRIVDLLSRAEEIIRLRCEAQKKADEIIPALFVDMFGDPATNTKGWPTQSLGELVTFVSGGTPSKSRDDFWTGDLPWVSPKDMKIVALHDAIDHVNRIVLEETNLKLIPIDSVLIVVRGMILIHTVPVAHTRVPLTINQDMKALVPCSALDSTYLVWALKVVHDRLLNMVSTAAHGTKKLDTARLEEMTIPVPPIDMQRNFKVHLDRIESIQKQQLAALANAEATFAALLAKLFS
jgi:type I restriction enzyme, S subunit